MFRTAGYYRGVNCPFFASGLCERPYCHFRHVKQDHNEDLNNKPQTPSSSKDASSYLEKLSDGQFPLTSESIRSFSKDKEEITDEKKSGKQAFNKYTGEPINDDEAELDISAGVSEVNKYTGKPIEYNKYTGEPIYHTEDSSSVNKRWTDSVLGNSNTPTYNPTPLSELQKRNANPNVSKYSLSASTSTSSQEYDPESNYSTSTKINHVPVPQVGRPSYKAKRSCSYDPSNATYKKPVLKRQRVASFFDAKFSSDEEEEVSSKNKNKNDNGKDEKSVSSEKEDKFHLKDVNYFEKLLDGPKDAKNSRVKVESDDSLDSLDEDVDVTPLIEKCRRRSQSGGTDQDSAEEKTEEKTKDLSKEDDSSHISTEIVSNTIKENCDSKDKKTKEKSGNDNRKSAEICDKNDKKNSASSSHSKSSHHRTSKSLKENSSKSSQDNGNSIHKSTKESSSKSSHQGTSNSSHKSSKESSAKSLHRKTEHSKLSHNREKNSHHPSSPKCQSLSVSKAEKVITKRKSRDSQDSKSSENENHVCDKSKDLSKSSNHHHKHSKHSNSELSSSSHKHQSNSEKGLEKNASHNSSHSSGSSKGSKDKQNKAKQRDSKEDNHKGTNSKSVSSDRRKSAESTKKKIVDINVDLFGADSEEEDDDDEDLVEVPMVTNDVNHSEQDMVMFLNDSDYSDEDIDRYDECLRIFQENKGMVNSNNANKKKSSPEKSHDEKVPAAPTGKQRMAHKKDSEMNRKMKMVEKPKVKMSPAEVMHNRFLQIQKKAQEAAAAAAAAKATSSGNNETASSSTTKNPLSGTKKRTAHTPSTSKTNGKPAEKTLITTASRTEKRKARTPNISNLVRPTIPSEFGSKVPYNVRQRYLNLIIDECLKICDSEQEAFDKGQVEEAAVYKRASSKTVYLNVAVNTIKRLRSEQAGPSNAKKPKQTVFQLSHEQILGGKNATKTTFTVNRSGGGSKLQEENFKGAELYKRLTRYILTEEQMKENGFPRPSPSVSGSAVFFVEPRKKINVQSSKPTNYEKLCVRCGKMFTVYPNGTYATKEECSYHWGKAWKKRIAGMIDTRYTCCQGDLSSDGCQISKGHVHETNKWEALSGYMKTFPCSPPCDGDYGVFALDCEMVYTKFGIELARVTVTDPENECVYETLVKPDAAVVDYNTRFSGLTEEDLKDVTTTLRDVQAVLLSLFSDRTIVMGHSLESDFSAVKLLHNTVVDTSVVFPHKMGPPYKRALKTLMAEYLKKIIQDDVGGHDSKEDSTSCMELMHLKIKEDARKEPRRS
ncbi:RNA exonuclease 1 homolog [Argopecten irradians]|uniref:RNA exonuclease 1 homolog n=1 Tax=Argopecten irradians TaxID=31199 RepID=UPI003719A0F9